eukprot:CAMPEP_0179487698 /NCGR_PEP_ID=MMETSP0799-20121207/63601_1 /TAXON_ID=46947 /ORGANISM="Geminigera cryophila, Strain CCMP2564" /LENGTH=88 /DNA_ID=CAMNT_0021302915 /DNA_START=646 /DNA_END=915 /DNA_ORIENTATION=-
MGAYSLQEKRPVCCKSQTRGKQLVTLHQELFGGLVSVVGVAMELYMPRLNHTVRGNSLSQVDHATQANSEPWPPSPETSTGGISSGPG